jgi:hypothetical protein
MKSAISGIEGALDDQEDVHGNDRARLVKETVRANMAIISGAHSIVYSTNPEADRAFFRDILQLSNVDVGGGWLIFGLPPSEIAVHPAETSGKHELYFMVDDIKQFIEQMNQHKIACTEVHNAGWGLLTRITLPGGGIVGVYEPRHARP